MKEFNLEHASSYFGSKLARAFTISIFLVTLLNFFYYYYGYDYRIYQLLWIFVTLTMIYCTYKLSNDFVFESHYFNILIHIFFLYELIIIFRGFLNNVNSSGDALWLLFCQPHIIWPLVIPLFIYFTKDIFIYQSIFNWIYLFGLIFLVLCILFPEILVNRTPAQLVITPLTSCLGYILLYSSYLNNKKVDISFLILMIGILSLTFLARRSGIVSLMTSLIAAYIINRKSENKAIVFRFLPLIIGVIVILFIYSPSIYSSLTGRLEQRLTENSRTYVFEMFRQGIKEDVFFGKGMYGTYFCPISGEIEEEGVTFAELDQREVIENGYLQLILSGGIVHLILFCFILYPAAYLGICKSSNRFSRASGSVILLWLIDMFLFGLPQLTMNYIFVWICVGICYKKSLRDKTDDEIRAEFQNSESI